VHDTAGTQQVLDELQFGVSWPDPEQVDVDREDLVEVLASERRLTRSTSARSTCWKTAFPEATWSALRLVARAIAIADRSMAVIRPPANCSQTSDTDTPGPGPISRISSLGEISSNCTAHCRRLGTRGPTMGRG